MISLGVKPGYESFVFSLLVRVSCDDHHITNSGGVLTVMGFLVSPFSLLEIPLAFLSTSSQFLASSMAYLTALAMLGITPARSSFTISSMANLA